MTTVIFLFYLLSFNFELRQRQDPLAIQARKVGRTMDAFLTPGAMFNHGIVCAALDSDDEDWSRHTAECVFFNSQII